MSSLAPLRRSPERRDSTARPAGPSSSAARPRRADTGASPPRTTRGAAGTSMRPSPRQDALRGAPDDPQHAAHHHPAGCPPAAGRYAVVRWRPRWPRRSRSSPSRRSRARPAPRRSTSATAPSATAAVRLPRPDERRLLRVRADVVQPAAHVDVRERPPSIWNGNQRVTLRSAATTFTNSYRLGSSILWTAGLSGCATWRAVAYGSSTGVGSTSGWPCGPPRSARLRRGARPPAPQRRAPACPDQLPP